MYIGGLVCRGLMSRYEVSLQREADVIGRVFVEGVARR